MGPLARPLTAVRGAALLFFFGVLVALSRAEALWRDAFWDCVLAVGLALAAVGASGRPGFGLLFSAAILAGQQLASAAKFSYTASPLLPYDVYFLLQSALTVVGDFPEVLLGALLVAAVFCAALAGTWILESPGPGRTPLRTEASLEADGLELLEPLTRAERDVDDARGADVLHRGWWGVWYRVLGCFGGTRWPFWRLLAVVVGTGLVFQAAWRLIDYPRVMWGALTNRSTSLSNFVFNMQYLSVVWPERSSVAEAREAFGSTLVDPPPSAPGSPPDIWLIQEESAWDPYTWAACNITSLCRPSMFLPDNDTLAIGVLRSSANGYGTWMVECAAHSGFLPWSFRGAAPEYAPFTLAPRMRHSLGGYLRSLGYVTVAVYPGIAAELNTRAAYRSYGFDRLYDAVHFGWGNGYHVPDWKIFQAALNVTESLRSQGRPLFVFMLTINNHRPHDYRPLPWLPVFWQTNRFPWVKDANEVVNLQTYLVRINESSYALGRLNAALAGTGRPFVLGSYGDHRIPIAKLKGLNTTLDQGRFLPAVAAQLGRFGKGLETYGTFYKFTSPGRSKVDLPPILDLAYIGLAALLAAGVPLDSFYASQKALMEWCAGQFVLCDAEERGRWFAWVLDVLGVMD
ncbi:hypothetical protein DFJ74DRAFT_684055 [Hyaloraphidium curvatum]|nr:hypothetical protein DFJ74DRAFT_684055 [Hyaloraphidium curvatum]